MFYDHSFCCSNEGKKCVSFITNKKCIKFYAKNFTQIKMFYQIQIFDIKSPISLIYADKYGELPFLKQSLYNIFDNFKMIFKVIFQTDS